MRRTATVTSKGQVTIPKEIRAILKARIVEFVVDGNRVELRPVASAEGGLAEYAKEFVALDHIRESVWANNGG